MRYLLLSLAALGSVTAVAANTPAAAQPVALGWSEAGVQQAQYYEYGWREREDWRRRQEWRRREEWRRRQEFRREREFRGPMPYYGPRY